MLIIIGCFLLGSSSVFATEISCAARVVSSDFANQQEFPQVTIDEKSGEKSISVGKFGNIEIRYLKSTTDLLLAGKGTFANNTDEFLAESTFGQLISPQPFSKPVPRTAGLSFDLRSKGIGFILLFCAEGNINYTSARKSLDF